MRSFLRNTGFDVFRSNIDQRLAPDSQANVWVKAGTSLVYATTRSSPLSP